MKRISQVAPISLFRYQSDKTTTRNQVSLQQNLFSFLLEGEKAVYYADRTIKIQPDQFMLLTSGNCLMSEKAAARPGGYRSLLLFFDNTVLTDFFTRYPGTLQTNVEGSREEPVLVFKKDPFLTYYIDSLNILLELSQTISAEMLATKLDELLLYISEHSPGRLQQLRSVGYDANQEIIIRQTVTANIFQPVTIEQLSFLCNTSISTFKRRFAKIYGSSPNKWLLEQRMRKAARLLKQGDHKATEIYDQVGYENLSSFIQSFKQIYGLTPKQYQLSE